jgi:Uma2 family endonuclease
MNTVHPAPAVESSSTIANRPPDSATQSAQPVVRAGTAYAVLSPAELAKCWLDHLESPDPSLPDLFELDEYGEIVSMNPPSTPHQRIVAFMRQLEAALGGEALPGISVMTRIGVRIPDVVWNPRFDGFDPAGPTP